MTHDQLTQDLAMIARNAIDLIRQLELEKQELLFALKRIGGRCDTEAAYKIARAAIIKAEGGQK